MNTYLVLYVDQMLDLSERFTVSAKSAQQALRQALTKFLAERVDPEELTDCVDMTIESSFRKTESRGGNVWTAADEEGSWLVTRI